MYLVQVWQFLGLKNTTTDSSCLGYVGAYMAVWVINSNNNYNSEIRTVTVLEWNEQ